MTQVDGRRARVFGRAAEAYHRWRLGYPAAAVDWVLPPGASDVLDLGAGTGKLTAPLAQRGMRVTAVDPDPRMLAILRRELPGVPACQARAEALPIRNASVDAVLVADAWHWFAHAPAIAEARRVLRPGGWLGLVWHGTDLADDWARELADLEFRSRAEGGAVAVLRSAGRRGGGGQLRLDVARRPGERRGAAEHPLRARRDER